MAIASQAQTQEFEVASVKLIAGPVRPHSVGLIMHHNRLNMDAAALRQIIGLAYGIQRVRVLGGPDWMDSDHWDIVAKAGSEEPDREQIKAMLRTLLTDRFKLAVHNETRELPVYSLVVAKNGPKLHEAQPEEKTQMRQGMKGGRLQFTYQRTPIGGGFVNLLANVLNSPVLDKTGLTGQYNFTLEYAPDFGPRPEGSAPPMLNGVPVDSGPSLFQAVQEQLGLKLEAKKGPTEVLIVDHAEKASAN